MKRRTFLASAVATTAFAGCLGDSDDGTATETADTTATDSASADDYATNGEFPPNEDPRNGFPPEFEDVPEERSVDTDAFGTTTQSGVDVPLVPVDVAHHWFRRREARFADARGAEQYDTSHVYGSVLSTAPDGVENDPVVDWPKDDRIVLYCGCPHHLSGMRAAALIEAGYEEVCAIDEGFWEWHARNYAMAGNDLSATPRGRVIRGRASPESAGETAWARHEPTGQREAATIDADGGYRMTLRFVDVDRDSPIVVETPDYTVEAPLGRLAGSTVTADLT